MDKVRAIKAELDADTLARGWSTMTDDQVVTSAALADIDLTVESLTGVELKGAIDDAEFAPKTVEEKTLIYSMIAQASIDPRAGSIDRQTVLSVFPSGDTETRTALAALQTRQITPAESIGTTPWSLGNVIEARRL